MTKRSEATIVDQVKDSSSVKYDGLELVSWAFDELFEDPRWFSRVSIVDLALLQFWVAGYAGIAGERGRGAGGRAPAQADPLNRWLRFAKPR